MIPEENLNKPIIITEIELKAKSLLEKYGSHRQFYKIIY